MQYSRQHSPPFGQSDAAAAGYDRAGDDDHERVRGDDLAPPTKYKKQNSNRVVAVLGSKFVA